MRCLVVDVGDTGAVSQASALVDRQAIRLSVIAAAALVLAVVVPPLGAVLGVVVVVLAVRSSRVLPRRTRTLVVAVGVLAAFVGVVVSGVAVVFGEEVADYSGCVQAANTQQARENCDIALREALRSRLGT
jgi:tRNA C32,U32 (ribose-2'-O)-methylase TrmJ